MYNLNNAEFQKKFDSIANRYEKISNQYTVRRRIEALRFESDASLLEVGSATGIIARNIGDSVVCSDISLEMCKEAKKKHAHVICCDAEMLPFKHGIFDTVISSEMIYYLKNPENFVSYCHHILAKNGKLVISMTNQDMAFIDKFRSIMRKIGMRRMYFDDGVRQFMSLHKLKLILNNYNFKIERIEKIVIFPFSAFDRINRLLEKTPLNRFSIFIVITAKKN